ncbi:ATP-binding protein [Streptomyces sp. NPDC127117]|uniref:ATP-binding protein n=1 Tax=Streptomyces sp. NPDC127117 TaxID=3345368 RepID=UPI0036275127
MTSPIEDNDSTAWVRIEARAEDSAHAYVAGRDQYLVHEMAPAPVTALRTLPRDVPGFTGRQAEVERLAGAAQPSGAVVIHTIDGMPGVGKTALAVHVAHQLSSSFPDGQLFVRLHGHTPGHRPADPADVLAALLISVGVDPRIIPDGLDARAGLWRDRLTGKRMLLVLDDASGHAQVEPLLPGAKGCLALVTSRRRLAALDGATPLPVGTLSPADAALLFTRLIHRPHTTSAESEAVAALVELCGCLPLAIALLAGRLAHHPHWNLAEFAEEFAATRDRLGELATSDRAVAAAFDTSYHGLPPERQRLFRRLGLHPGTDTDAYATAALAGISLTQARRDLEALYESHLIDSPATGRYRLHDLIHAYSRTLAEQDPADDGDAGIGRLLAYYQHTAQSADRHFANAPSPTIRTIGAAAAATPDLPTHQQALAWMRTERANLIACIHHTTATAQHSRAIHLTAALASFLRLQGPWDEAIALHQTAVTAAQHIHDRHGEAGALWALGWLRYYMGDCRAAADLNQRALELYRSLGDRPGEAGNLWALGWLRHETGDYAAATDLGRRALKLYCSLGDRLGEAYALWALGRIQTVTGNYAAAADLTQQALDLSRARSHRNGEATALWELGRIRTVTGNYAAAADLGQQALDLYCSLGNRLGEAYALCALARVRNLMKDYAAAADLGRRALELHRFLGDRNGEATALWELGRTRTITGNHAAAGDLLHQSLILFQEAGNVQGEAEVLNSTGDLLAKSAVPQRALVTYRQALDVARQAMSPLDEAHALEGIARTSDHHAALADLRQAVSIYRRIGVPEATSAAEYLAQLQAEHSKRLPFTNR